MRFVAVGAAGVAMVFTLVAVIVVLARDGEPVKASPAQPSMTDHVVPAAEIVKLRNEVELVVDDGKTQGVRIKDAALAKLLGLEPDDVLSALSGKALVQERDVTDVITRVSMMSATTLYAEVSRKGKPLLVRWKLDGDLRQARYAAPSSSSSSLGGFGIGSSYTPPPVPSAPDPDPLLDTIEEVDDTHYKVPRKTVDAMLANPMQFMKGARVVPAMRNGQPDGFKMYAIRPSSPFAKLGFHNGDTVHAINGFELDTPDKALEIYTKLRDATELTFDLTRRGKPVALSIQITK